MVKRILWGALAALVLAVAAVLAFGPGYVEAGRNTVATHEPYPVSAEAQALHDGLVIGDLHADPLLWNRDLTRRSDRGHVDIPRLIEGNVAVQVFTAVTKSPAGQNYEANSAEAFDNITPLAVGQLWPLRTWGSLKERAIYQAEKLHRFAERSDGRLRVILTRADLDRLLADRAAGQQVVGGLLGIEGAHPLEGDIGNLDDLQAAGHRLIGLQHFFDNALGTSLHGQAEGGLTEFGRQVVAEVEARGLILDVAHSSPAVVRDVLDMTDMPIVLSHTGIFSACESARNVPDALMRDIAATGGVIGIGYWADAICDDSPAGIAAAIMAAVALVGAEHVGLGSDFDGSVGTALDTSELAAITQALVDAGLPEEDIARVMGGNMVRVLRARLPE